MALLEVKDLKVSYGMIKAIKGVSFEVNEGEVIALIGANGAGKTTIMESLAGIIQDKTGTIIFDGKEVSKMPCHKIIESGLSLVPEGRRVFGQLSVFENLQLGAYTRPDKKEFATKLEYIYETFPILKERNKQLAGTLSGGEQQMLAMGRALMAQPKIILMDEPSMGLSPLYVQRIFGVIKMLKEAGSTILLVEQNAKQALSIADRAYVLETGNVTISGNAKELLTNEAIIKAYLN
ncbi:MAG: ABC transporter ATP-binding protein [Bacillota bacterium]